MNQPTPRASYDPEDAEGFDDLPETELDEEEYEAFLEREFDGAGRLRPAPRVGWFLALAIVLLGMLALLLFR